MDNHNNDNDQQINDVIAQVNEFINEDNNNINYNLNTVCIYDPVQYNYLWKTSWLFLVTTCYAAGRPNYEFVFWPGSIFLTSINYWKNPVHDSWERKLDITCVFVSISYNIIRSIGAEYANPFYGYLLVGFSSYLLSNYNHRQNRLYISALLHSFVHLFCNMALIYLYSGQILSTLENPVTKNFWNMCEELLN